VYFTTHAYLGRDNADPKIDTFRKAYSRAYQGRAPNAFAALGYDTVHLLVAAINRARSAGSNSLLDALARRLQHRRFTRSRNNFP
jgi:branched-chain amino acid transport system substrate-binding protein